MKKCAVSVIVPIYNSEKNLQKTLEKICAQSIWNTGEIYLELILVNDASADHSIEIMKKVQAKFPEQIKCIDLPENHGPGGARNYGMQIAAGEYIGFVDSDDLIEKNMYEKLYAAATKDGQFYDVADCAIRNEANKTEILYTPQEATGVLQDTKRSLLISEVGFPVTKIYAKNLLLGQRIFFRENAVMEDQDFLSEVYARAGSITTVPEVLYTYCDTPDSASKKDAETVFFDATVRTVRAMHDRLRVLPDYEGFRLGAEYFFWEMFESNMRVIDAYCEEGFITAELADQMRGILLKLIRDVCRTGVKENHFAIQKFSEEQIAYIEKKL